MQCAKENKITHLFKILKHELHKHVLYLVFTIPLVKHTTSLFQAPWALGSSSTLLTKSSEHDDIENIIGA